jgi:hypothetical protein
VAERERALVGDELDPYDFPEENYEATWPNRFHPGDLNEIGRRGLGLQT